MSLCVLQSFRQDIDFGICRAKLKLVCTESLKETFCPLACPFVLILCKFLLLWKKNAPLHFTVSTKYCHYTLHAMWVLAESVCHWYTIGAVHGVAGKQCSLTKFKQKRCNSEITFTLLICNRKKKYLKHWNIYLAATREAAWKVGKMQYVSKSTS